MGDFYHWCHMRDHTRVLGGSSCAYFQTVAKSLKYYSCARECACCVYLLYSLQKLTSFVMS